MLCADPPVDGRQSEKEWRRGVREKSEVLSAKLHRESMNGWVYSAMLA